MQLDPLAISPCMENVIVVWPGIRRFAQIGKVGNRLNILQLIMRSRHSAVSHCAAPEPGVKSGWAEPPAAHVTCRECLRRLTPAERSRIASVRQPGRHHSTESVPDHPGGSASPIGFHWWSPQRRNRLLRSPDGFGGSWLCLACAIKLCVGPLQRSHGTASSDFPIRFADLLAEQQISSAVGDDLCA